MGYKVFVAARDKYQLEVCTSGFEADRFIPVVTDVADPDSVQQLFTQIRNDAGQLNLLFNNAGNNSPATSVEDISFQEWLRVFNVNVHGSFLCAQEAIKIMKNQRPMGGRIINNASVSSMSPRLYSAAYTASKHAITGLTKSISLDCRQYGIACGQINIGNAETDMFNRIRKGVYQADGSIQAEDMINVSDVAQAIAMIASMPVSTNVLELTIMANKMPFVGRG